MPLRSLPLYQYLDTLNAQLASATSLVYDDFSDEDLAWFRRPVAS